MAENNSKATEEVSDGLKLRKKNEQPAPEAAPEPTAREAAPAPSAPSAPEPVASDEKEAEKAFDPSTLSRRVVDPKKGDPARAKPAKVEPVTTFTEDVTTDDFAAMFEQAPEHVPQRRTYEIGDKVEALITHIDSTHVYADLGGRNEASAPRAHYVDSEGHLTVSVGDTQEFFVLGFRGGIQLGARLDAGADGLGGLEDAQASGLPVQGRVTSKNKGGFVVEISGVETFCPMSQIDLYNAEDLEVYVGQTFSFKVIEVRDGRNVVVSRAALLREEQAKQREETMKRLAPGEIITGTVRSISDFGAFVDLGGVDGLVHISELSWSNVDKPGDVVKEGQSVEVKILEMEPSRDGKRPRISLSMKQAQEDPWSRVNEQFHIGMDTRGRVVRTAPFGAFVEIAPGIDGLVHVSEMSWEHVRHPSAVVNNGDEVDVQILDIDLTRQRISLSMKAAAGDPWTGIEERFPVGEEVTGMVEKIEDFGVFINLDGGVTALLPRSEMNLGRGETPHTKARVGSDITARVLSIEQTRRRMALSLRSQDDIEANAPAPSQGGDRGGSRRDDRKGGGSRGASSARSYDESPGNFGTLGDLLKQKKKN